MQLQRSSLILETTGKQSGERDATKTESNIFLTQMLRVTFKENSFVQKYNRCQENERLYDVCLKMNMQMSKDC